MSAQTFAVERSDRLRMTFAGAQAKASLGGLVTNDVAALTAGAGQRAAALTPKGRVIALCRVLDRGDDLLVDCDASAGEGFVAMIRKFVNPRLAKYTDVTATTGCIGVHGGEAASVVAEALAAGPTAHAAIVALAPHHGARFGDGDAAAWVVRSDDLATPGFDVIARGARIDAVRDALRAKGIAFLEGDALLAERIEGGVPAWGVEIDGETIPQEAELDKLGAISFSKGCYTGQEVVARIHFRGHVNRHLRRLESDAPLARGARVLDASGAEVGDVRSAVVSPTRGPLAIAMVRREVEPGASVTVQGDATTVAARVRALTR